MIDVGFVAFMGVLPPPKILHVWRRIDHNHRKINIDKQSCQGVEIAKSVNIIAFYSKKITNYALIGCDQ